MPGVNMNYDIGFPSHPMHCLITCSFKRVRVHSQMNINYEAPFTFRDGNTRKSTFEKIVSRLSCFNVKTNCFIFRKLIVRDRLD